MEKDREGTAAIAELDSGRYFWRVGAWDGASKGYSYSIERRVTLEEDRAPRLWKPEANARVAFKGFWIGMRNPERVQSARWDGRYTRPIFLGSAFRREAVRVPTRYRS
ncbi:MAG: hypothetical protein R3B54_15700 [Bdellovibrionota bacterium]